jgi:predicted acetyltransferase
MDIDIRTIEPEEFEAFTRAGERAFSAYPEEEELENWRLVAEPGRYLVAVDDGRFVGTAGAFSLNLTVPGGEVPMAGVTAVGVVPTHRRRGILTSLMRRQLDDIRDASKEPVAGLWASEGAIYWRFGYGAACQSASIEVERDRAAFTRSVEPMGRLSMVEKEQAMEAFPPVFDRARSDRPGMWGRDERWWKNLYADLENWRRGFGALLFAVHEGPAGADGYVAYRVKHDWDQSGPGSTLSVKELIATTREAYEALWRFCFGVDLMRKIQAWPRPADEPLLHMLAEPRALGFRLGDGLWIRVVDVERALSSRAYSAPGRLAFEVRDGFCPWTEGRYQLEIGSDGGECHRTNAEPDLILDAADLGATYLGGVRFSTLHRAGRIVEARPGALRRADAMFAWDPLPWCPAVF